LCIINTLAEFNVTYDTLPAIDEKSISQGFFLSHLLVVQVRKVLTKKIPRYLKKKNL